MKEASANIDLICTRQTVRQIDRKLKVVELQAKDALSLQEVFRTKISALDTSVIFGDFRMKLQSYIDQRDLFSLMRVYDNKGTLSLVAQVLGLKNQRVLLEKTSRLLAEDRGEKLRSEFTNLLPAIPL